MTHKHWQEAIRKRPLLICWLGLGDFRGKCPSLYSLLWGLFSESCQPECLQEECKKRIGPLLFRNVKSDLVHSIELITQRWVQHQWTSHMRNHTEVDLALAHCIVIFQLTFIDLIIGRIFLIPLSYSQLVSKLYKRG